MVKWQVRGLVWKEENHGGNEDVILRNEPGVFPDAVVSLEGAMYNVSCTILAHEKRFLVTYCGFGIFKAQNWSSTFIRGILLCREMLIEYKIWVGGDGMMRKKQIIPTLSYDT